ncbi:MAG: hypothetical protein J4F48_04405 [Nitrospinae bacterium]|nr:hypothetical protein [Nitrospinota bacterium]
MASRKTLNHPRIAREPSLYHLTPDASGGAWDLYRVSQEFDSTDGDLNETLIESLNHWASREPRFTGLRILEDSPPIHRPREILLLDGSPSRLPLTMETARVMRAHLKQLGLSIPVRVLNRREELLARAAKAPKELLVISQTAQRSLYDATLAKVLETRGIVVAPGSLTAPGGPLSNKKTTYELLNGNGENVQNPKSDGHGHRLTARYEVVESNGGRPADTAAAILDSASALSQKWGAGTFFVKPQEGGGGRGCFRLDVYPNGFGMPDLSRLGVAAEHATPLPLSLDADDHDHLQAMDWLVHRFQASPATSRAYIKTQRVEGGSSPGVLGELLRNCAPRLESELREASRSRKDSIRLLASAIENYEQVFDTRYLPLICNWIDFGLFSVRVHLRLSREGIVVETIYARLFPVEFSDDSVGVVGVDSITNRTEGGMELNRYAPLLPPLVAYAGGAERLCEKIRGAFDAFARFLSLLDPGERGRVPVRAEFDLSPLNGLIAEGNADPVRAQCANSRWERFSENCAQWTEDALSFYSWKSQKV